MFKLNNHTICTLFTVCWAMLCRLFSAFFFICVLVTKGILRLHLRHTCWYKVKDKYRYWNSRANGLPKTIQCIQFYSLQVQGQKSRPLYFFILIFCWFCYNIRTFINFIIYIDLLTKNGIFIKNILPDVCIKTILWLVRKRNGFIFYKYKLNSNKMEIISTHQTLFSTKSYKNSFSFGNDELDAWIEHHRLFRKPLSIAIKLLTDTMSR